MARFIGYCHFVKTRYYLMLKKGRGIPHPLDNNEHIIYIDAVQGKNIKHKRYFQFHSIHSMVKGCTLYEHNVW